MRTTSTKLESKIEGLQSQIDKKTEIIVHQNIEVEMFLRLKHALRPLLRKNNVLRRMVSPEKLMEYLTAEAPVDFVSSGLKELLTALKSGLDILIGHKARVTCAVHLGHPDRSFYSAYDSDVQLARQQAERGYVIQTNSLAGMVRTDPASVTGDCPEDFPSAHSADGWRSSQSNGSLDDNIRSFILCPVYLREQVSVGVIQVDANCDYVFPGGTDAFVSCVGDAVSILLQVAVVVDEMGLGVDMNPVTKAVQSTLMEE